MPLIEEYPTADLSEKLTQKTSEYIEGGPNSDVGSWFHDWNIPDINLMAAGGAPLYGLAALGTFGVNMATRLQLNKVLGGKHVIDDVGVAAARTVRTTMYSVGGEVAGALAGAGIANSLVDDNANFATKLAVRGGGALAGGSIGHLANTFISTVNGAHLGYELTGNILETRGKVGAWMSKIPGSKLAGALAGAATGFAVASVPFGQLAMNAVGFNISDYLSDRNEANKYGIAGEKRGKYFEGTRFEMEDKLKLGNFIEETLSPAESLAMKTSLQEILDRVHHAPTDTEKNEIFSDIQKFLPVHYQEISDVPDTPLELLQDAAQSTYRIRKKWKKDGKDMSHLPHPTEIIENAQKLSRYLQGGSEISGREMLLMLNPDPRNPEYWQKKRNIIFAVLENEDVKTSIIEKLNNRTIEGVYKKLNPSATSLPSLPAMENAIKSASGMDLYESFGPRNQTLILNFIQNHKKILLENSIVKANNLELTRNEHYRPKDFSMVSTVAKELYHPKKGETKEEGGITGLIKSTKENLHSILPSVFMAKDLTWDQLSDQKKADIKNWFSRKKKK